MNFMLLVARATSHSFAALTREILLLPLEHKIHIFSPPCNILYLVNSDWSNKTKQAIQLGYVNRIIYSNKIIRSKEKNEIHLRN